jgi:hypothetical protein
MNKSIKYTRNTLIDEVEDDSSNLKTDQENLNISGCADIQNYYYQKETNNSKQNTPLSKLILEIKFVRSIALFAYICLRILVYGHEYVVKFNIRTNFY